MFKFLKAGLISQHGSFKWKLGKWEKHQGELIACFSGFHASVRPSDALVNSSRRVPGEIIAKVEVRGVGIVQADKQVWSEMRIVRAWHWDKEDSVALAAYAAELVIHLYEEQEAANDLPRRAIEAAKASLSNGWADAEVPVTVYAALAAADATDAIETANTRNPANYSVYAVDAAIAAANAAAATTAVNAATNAARAIRAAASAVTNAAAAKYGADAYTAADTTNVLDKCDGWILARIATLAEIEECTAEGSKNV